MGNRYSRPSAAGLPGAPSPPPSLRASPPPASLPPSPPTSRPASRKDSRSPSRQPSLQTPPSPTSSSESESRTLPADEPAPKTVGTEPQPAPPRKWRRLTLKRTLSLSPSSTAKPLPNDTDGGDGTGGNETAVEDTDVPIPPAFTILEKEYLSIAADYALARRALPRETEGYRLQLAGGETLARAVHARHGVYAALLTKLRTRVEAANSWTMSARYLEHETGAVELHLSEIATERGFAAAHLAVVERAEPSPPRDLASRLDDADKVIAYFSSQRCGLQRVLAADPRRYDLLLPLFTDKLQCSLGIVDNEVRALLQEVTLAAAVSGDDMVLPPLAYHAAFDMVRAGVQALEDEVCAYRSALKVATACRARALAAAQSPITLLDECERDIRFEAMKAKALISALRPLSSSSPPAAAHNMNWWEAVVTP